MEREEEEEEEEEEEVRQTEGSRILQTVFFLFFVPFLFLLFIFSPSRDIFSRSLRKIMSISVRDQVSISKERSDDDWKKFARERGIEADS